ncbi:MAG: hypothetical protein OCD01_00720 [Fibrobacterales bacterium]
MAIKVMSSGAEGVILSYDFYFNTSFEELAEMDYTFFVSVEFFSVKNQRLYEGCYYSFTTAEIEDDGGYGKYSMKPNMLLEVEESPVYKISIGYKCGEFDLWESNGAIPILSQTIDYEEELVNLYNIRGIEQEMISAGGVWQQGTSFIDDATNAAVFLRVLPEIAGHIDIHTHLQSNHCAPLPLVWDKAAWLSFDSDTLDTLAPIATSEFGATANKPTDDITKICVKHLKNTLVSEVFDCYDVMPVKIANCVGMDMDFGHYFGYYGVPMYQIYYETPQGWVTQKPDNYIKGVTNREITVPLTKYNHSKFQLNVIELFGTVVSRTKLVKKFVSWAFGSHKKIGNNECHDYVLKKVNVDLFEDWDEQIESYHKGTVNNPLEILSFFHLDPRRYYLTEPDEPNHFLTDINEVFERIVQCDEFNELAGSEVGGGSIGIKMYTALGYAPIDPFVKEVQDAVYKKCVDNNLGIICHNSPEGFYSCDRARYYDLLANDGKINPDSDGSENYDLDAGLPSNPEGTFPKYLYYQTKNGIEKKVPKKEEEKIYWYNQNYTNPECWRKVVDAPKYKYLKVCLAHFTGLQHFDEKRKGRNLKKYDPFDHKNFFNGVIQKIVTVMSPYGPAVEYTRIKNKHYPSFNLIESELAKHADKVKDGEVIDETDANKTVDPFKTYKNVYDLMTMISKDNRLFFDISYAIMNENHANGLLRFFVWAKLYKPIVLERILWGTDWPLIGAEKEINKGLFKTIGRRIKVEGRFKGAGWVAFLVPVLLPVVLKIVKPSGKGSMDSYSIFEPYNEHNFQFFKLLNELIKPKTDDPDETEFADEALKGFQYRDLGDFGLELWIRFTYLNTMQFIGMSGKESDKNLMSSLDKVDEIFTKLKSKKLLKERIQKLKFEMDAKSDDFNKDKFEIFLKSNLFKSE